MNNTDFEDITGNFSVSKLKFLKGCITQNEDGMYALFLPIAKFILDAETVETSILLDFIELPETLSWYIGKSVVFPVNPVEGYIDGSIYLKNAHSPVDVTELRFISLENDILTIEISMQFDFEFERIGFKNESLKEIFVLEKK